MHQRALIRQAIVSHLVSATTSAGARVFATRTTPFRKVELPAIAVYTLEETVDDISPDSAPREMQRTVTVAVHAALNGTETLDDDLDAISLQIEKVMNSDDTLFGTCAVSALTSTAVDLEEIGEKRIGHIRLNYLATYYTYAPEAADVSLLDLETVDVLTRANGVGALDQAEDTLTDLED